MKRISSRVTVFAKRVFPVFVVFAVIAGLVPTIVNQGIEATWWLALLVALGLGIGGFAYARRMLPLADEVQDAGTHLLVRRGGVEERVELADIVNVSCERTQNSHRIVLRLRKPGKFGDEIPFIPLTQLTLNPFARNAIGEDLIRRVDAARRSA